MAITGGFGMQVDLKSGTSRAWYMRGGIKRWVDNDGIVDGARDAVVESKGSDSKDPATDGLLLRLVPDVSSTLFA